MQINPDKNWYKSISEKKALPTRCPYASVERCPRYFQSVALHEATGGTALDPKEEKRLTEKWENSELWPRLPEQATSAFIAGEKLSFILHFCPEFTYQRFGLFCTGIGFHTDEIDRDAMHAFLKRENVPMEDPRWLYAHVTSEHYSDCDMYSLIQHSKSPFDNNQKTEPWWREHAAKIVVGIAIALAGAVFKLWFS